MFPATIDAYARLAVMVALATQAAPTDPVSFVIATGGWGMVVLVAIGYYSGHIVSLKTHTATSQTLTDAHQVAVTALRDTQAQTVAALKESHQHVIEGMRGQIDSLVAQLAAERARGLEMVAAERARGLEMLTAERSRCDDQVTAAVQAKDEWREIARTGSIAIRQATQVTRDAVAAAAGAVNANNNANRPSGGEGA